MKTALMQVTQTMSIKLKDSEIGQIITIRRVFYVPDEHFTYWKDTRPVNDNKVIERTKTETNCMVLDMNRFKDEYTNDVCLVKLLVISQQIVIWVDGNELNVIEAVLT